MPTMCTWTVKRLDLYKLNVLLWNFMMRLFELDQDIIS